MCEYSMSEAKELLNSNLEKAKSQIKVNENDLDFVKDHIISCEVYILEFIMKILRKYDLKKREYFKSSLIFICKNTFSLFYYFCFIFHRKKIFVLFFNFNFSHNLLLLISILFS